MSEVITEVVSEKEDTPSPETGKDSWSYQKFTNRILSQAKFKEYIPQEELPGDISIGRSNSENKLSLGQELARLILRTDSKQGEWPREWGRLILADMGSRRLTVDQAGSGDSRTLVLLHRKKEFPFVGVMHAHPSPKDKQEIFLNKLSEKRTVSKEDAPLRKSASDYYFSPEDLVNFILDASCQFDLLGHKNRLLMALKTDKTPLLTKDGLIAMLKEIYMSIPTGNEAFRKACDELGIALYAGKLSGQDKFVL
ncbi:MAG: hypothetical protein ABIH88_02645, partial [Patescibacteria group bacterium]